MNLDCYPTPNPDGPLDLRFQTLGSRSTTFFSSTWAVPREGLSWNPLDLELDFGFFKIWFASVWCFFKTTFQTSQVCTFLGCEDQLNSTAQFLLSRYGTLHWVSASFHQSRHIYISFAVQNMNCGSLTGVCQHLGSQTKPCLQGLKYDCDAVGGAWGENSTEGPIKPYEAFKCLYCTLGQVKIPKICQP